MKLRGLSRRHAAEERSRGADRAPADPREMDASCPHVTMIPRWDRAEDMGHDDRVASYHCEGCGHTFTAEEGAQLRATESTRIGRTLS